MLVFCQQCSNRLVVEEGDHCLRLACRTCPYVHNIVRNLSQRHYPVLKELDDVLGGEEAWKNAQQTEERCPQCDHLQAYFMQMQTRSADEPMTTKYRCVKCTHIWND